MRCCFPIRFCKRSTESPETLKNAKVFEHFLKLPNEGRMMIIDEMEADDRCRFTRCSKVCQKEAKASKNYIYGMKFYFSAGWDSFIEIKIVHYEYIKLDYLVYSGNISRGYILRFEGTLLRYFSIENRDKELWREELDISTDIVEYVIQQFKDMLQMYQTRIKKLVIEEMFSDELKHYDFGIKNLKNLEKLSIGGNIDMLKYISKVRKPLTSLEWYRKEKHSNDILLANFQQIYLVQSCLQLPHTKLNNQQFQRLSASWVHIDIGYLTEEDIFNFIRSWQNGTIGRTIRRYEWSSLKSSNFEFEKLVGLLGAEPISRTCYWIEDHTDARKRAHLVDCEYRDVLVFTI